MATAKDEAVSEKFTNPLMRDYLQKMLDEGRLDSLTPPGEGEELEVSVVPRQEGPVPETPVPPAEVPETPVPQENLPPGGMQGPVQPPEVPEPPVEETPQERYDINPPPAREVTKQEAAGLPEMAPEVRKRGRKRQRKELKAAAQKDAFRRQEESEGEATKALRRKYDDPAGPEGSGVVDAMFKRPKTGARRAMVEGARQRYDTLAAEGLERELKSMTAEQENLRTEREYRLAYDKGIRAAEDDARQYGTPIPLDQRPDFGSASLEELAAYQDTVNRSVASDRNAELAINQALPFTMKAAEKGADPSTLLDATFEHMKAKGHPIERDQYDRLMNRTNKMLMSVAAGAIQERESRDQLRQLRGLTLQNQALALDAQLLRARMDLDAKNVQSYERNALAARRIRDDLQRDIIVARDALTSYRSAQQFMGVPEDPAEVADRQEQIAQMESALADSNRKIEQMETMAAQAGVSAGSQQGPVAAFDMSYTDVSNQFLPKLALRDLEEGPRKPGHMDRRMWEAQKLVTGDLDLRLDQFGAPVNPVDYGIAQEYSRRLAAELETNSELKNEFMRELEFSYLPPDMPESQKAARRAYWQQLWEEGQVDAP